MTKDTTAYRNNIVIIGGSYGGLSIAHYLLRRVVSQLPDNASLVSCRPARPRALISDDVVDQNKLFATATKLDHIDRFISVNSKDGNTERIDYDALVISTGASTPSPLHGLNRDEDFLKANWKEVRQVLPNVKTIVIAGGGPAAIETAGKSGEYLNGRAGWFSSPLANPKVAITVVNSDSEILPVLRRAIALTAGKFLAKVGVTVIQNARVKSVTPQGAGTETALTSSKPNTAFIPEELLTSDGRVDTNSETLRVDKAGERVYAIEDVGSYSRPAIHIILEAIPVLAANMMRDLMLASGKEGSEVEDRKFKEDGKFQFMHFFSLLMLSRGNISTRIRVDVMFFLDRETQMVPIGKSKDVGAAMGYQLPSFMTWLVKGRDYWLWTTGGLWTDKQRAKEK